MTQAETFPEREKPLGKEALRQEIEAKIRRLERSAGHGLWGMVIFLLVSVAAFNNFSIFPEISESTRRFLGAPPPASMISLALVIYTFSGIIYVLARMTRNIQSYRGLMHAGFFAAFYAFYYLSGYLHENFWAVFFAGMSLMGLENFYLWSHSSSAIRREKALLENLERGRPLFYGTDEEQDG